MLRLQLVAEELRWDKSPRGMVQQSTRPRHQAPPPPDASKQTRQQMLDRIKGARRGRRIGVYRCQRGAA